MQELPSIEVLTKFEEGDRDTTLPASNRLHTGQQQSLQHHRYSFGRSLQCGRAVPSEDKHSTFPPSDRILIPSGFNSVNNIYCGHCIRSGLLHLHISFRGLHHSLSYPLSEAYLVGRLQISRFSLVFGVVCGPSSQRRESLENEGLELLRRDGEHLTSLACLLKLSTRIGKSAL